MTPVTAEKQEVDFSHKHKTDRDRVPTGQDEVGRAFPSNKLYSNITSSLEKPFFSSKEKFSSQRGDFCLQARKRALTEN